jgi:hypothetical protein
MFFLQLPKFSDTVIYNGELKKVRILRTFLTNAFFSKLLMVEVQKLKFSLRNNFQIFSPD